MIIFRKITIEQVEKRQFAASSSDCKCAADNYTACACMGEDGC